MLQFDQSENPAFLLRYYSEDFIYRFVEDVIAIAPSGYVAFIERAMDKDPKYWNKIPILRLIAEAARSCRQAILESNDMSPPQAAEYMRGMVLSAVKDIFVR
jgi:hypothetical protein